MGEIRFECPKCRQSLAAPEELATQMIDCPTCSEAIHVPLQGRPLRAEAPPPQAQIARPAEQGNLNMLLGIAGSLILVLGVFAPLIRLPTLGTMNYFGNGKGDGVVFLILAVASLVLSVMRRHRGLWITGIISAALLLFGFIGFQDVVTHAEQKSAATGRPVDVQLEWGWALLIVGTLLIVIAAALKPQKENQG